MILHCVFCSFRDEVSSKQRINIFQELATFSQSLTGVLGFDFGPNRDFEMKSQKFSDGFVIRFEDRQALKAYLVHPVHQQLGRKLTKLCDHEADGIIVFDLDISNRMSRRKPAAIPKSLL